MQGRITHWADPGKCRGPRAHRGLALAKKEEYDFGKRFIRSCSCRTEDTRQHNTWAQSSEYVYFCIERMHSFCLHASIEAYIDCAMPTCNFSPSFPVAPGLFDHAPIEARPMDKSLLEY